MTKLKTEPQPDRVVALHSQHGAGRQFPEGCSIFREEIFKTPVPLYPFFNAVCIYKITHFCCSNFIPNNYYPLNNTLMDHGICRPVISLQLTFIFIPIPGYFIKHQYQNCLFSPFSLQSVPIYFPSIHEIFNCISDIYDKKESLSLSPVSY